MDSLHRERNPIHYTQNMENYCLIKMCDIKEVSKSKSSNTPKLIQTSENRASADAKSQDNIRTAPTIQPSASKEQNLMDGLHGFEKRTIKEIIIFNSYFFFFYNSVAFFWDNFGSLLAPDIYLRFNFSTFFSFLRERGLGIKSRYPKIIELMP